MLLCMLTVQAMIVEAMIVEEAKIVESQGDGVEDVGRDGIVASFTARRYERQDDDVSQDDDTS